MIGTATETATLITAIAAAIVSIITALKAQQVHSEVKTLNAKTIGILAGEQETRRIEDKPLGDRTEADQRHLLDVPPEHKDAGQILSGAGGWLLVALIAACAIIYIINNVSVK